MKHPRAQLSVTEAHARRWQHTGGAHWAQQLAHVALIDHGPYRYTNREFHAPITQKRDLEQRQVDFGVISNEGAVLDEVCSACLSEVRRATRHVKQKAALIEGNDSGVTVARKIVTIFGGDAEWECPRACKRGGYANYRGSGHSRHCQHRQYLQYTQNRKNSDIEFRRIGTAINDRGREVLDAVGLL